MRYLLFFIILISFSCNSVQPDLSAQEIIDKSIKMSGANKVANATLFFKFREMKYTALRKNGKFTLTRNSSDSITDILTNDGFERLINGKKVKLIDSISSKYANSVNSVHYFSVLPYGLNNKAVCKKLLKSVHVKGEPYYKIQVTFSENGGGKDFEDVFIYWVGKDDFLIDYLAYSYHTDGGGMRFRALKDEKNINDIRFVNYDNYKPKSKGLDFINIDKVFDQGELIKVSEIVLENISVN